MRERKGRGEYSKGGIEREKGEKGGEVGKREKGKNFLLACNLASSQEQANTPQTIVKLLS